MVNGKRVIFMMCMAACTSSEQLTADGGHGRDGPLPGDGDVEISKSGTRIKVSYLTTADGAKIFNGTFDAQRNEPCVFTSATDGVTRCLPLYGLPIASAGDLYSDAGCTISVAAIASCITTAPKYAVRSSFICDKQRNAVHAIGAEHVGQVYTRSGVRCDVSPVIGFRFYAVGSEIPASAFAAATTAVE